MSRRKLWARRILLLGLLGLAIQQIYRHGQDYVLIDQFATVEPGRIYRGAWQQPWPMRRLIRNYHIKTVVALAHPADHPLSVREKALAKELGVRWIHIPIVDDRTSATRKSVSDCLEAAANELAKPENQPVYFHCHHGVNRASMVQMAYRMQHCGWSLDRATEEIARTFGLREVDHGPDYRHMKQYYEERVRPNMARMSAPAGTAALR